MIDTRRCIRCYCELEMLEYNDAEDYEEELMLEGMTVDTGDALCDECVEELVA